LAPGTTSDLLPQRLAPGIAATAAAFPPRGPKPEGWSENSWRREGPYDSVNVTPLGHWLGLRQRGLFSAVFAAVVLLVLIAAANVSSLMTSRAAERRREMDMRVALGAGPGAITRLWTLEAATLVTAGGVLGVIAATPTLQLVLALLPESTVLLKPAALDWRVAGFVAITVLVLSMLVSATPVSRSLRALAGVAKGGGSDRARTGARVVISGQVAAAFVLTVVGACLVGSLLAVYGNDRPIRTADLLVVEGRITGGPGRGMGRSPERPARAEPIVERLRRIGGVSGVTLVEAQLLRGGGWDAPFRRPEGRTSVRDADCWAITAGFYDVVGLRAIEGRLHTDAELRSNAPFIVVSERIARAYWPGASPIGEVLTTHDKQAFSVIGVVPEVPWFAWDLESPMFYGPYASLARSGLLTFFIRTSGRTGPIIAEALRTIADADRQVRLNKAAPLSTLFRDSISLRRFQSWLFGGFAAAALAVVGVGILGLLAMSAARRTREIGIRCALGATPSLVTRQLVREQLIPVVVGLAIGGAVAAWAVGFVERYLYKLTVTDPRIWSAAIALILATALLGALLPARRASRIDPVKALRVE
jgi:predicted permease